jgi:hypothetical protein
MTTNDDNTIRIFVGTPANNEDLECQAVIDFALRQHATRPLDITYMMVSRDPASFWYSGYPYKNAGWNMKTWATPFSALRWGIPEFCNFKGRAIYMDCDQIPLADIAELADQDIPDGRAFLGKGAPRDVVSCCMLFDNARMQLALPPINHLRTDSQAFRQIRRNVLPVMANFENDWNCRDGEGCQSIFEAHVKNVHYTDIPTQPNHKYARERLKREGREHWWPGPDRPHPRKDITELFDTMLANAIAVGRGPETFRVDPMFGIYGR